MFRTITMLILALAALASAYADDDSMPRNS